MRDASTSGQAAGRERDLAVPCCLAEVLHSKRFGGKVKETQNEEREPVAHYYCRY